VNVETVCPAVTKQLSDCPNRAIGIETGERWSTYPIYRHLEKLAAAKRNASRKLMVLCHKYRSLLALSALLLYVGTSIAQKSDDSYKVTAARFSEASATFNKRCTACHTYGKGVKIGPDLKGVNERRTREWLIKFVRASSQLIQSADPAATSLFVQFKQQRMPDWTDLSDQQIGDLLDYIAVGGPDIRPADERDAELATVADVNEGRRLFLGEARFRFGAHACATCHTVNGTGLRGGTLGPDLSKVYTTFQDRALTEFFRHPCFQSDPSAPAQYLSVQESFALKAFLHQIATHSSASGKSKSAGQVGLTENSEQPSRQASLSSNQVGKGSGR
jgi:mono/diheme cytochrome c family protein